MPTKEQLDDMSNLIYRGPFRDRQPNEAAEIMALAIAANQANALLALSNCKFF